MDDLIFNRVEGVWVKGSYVSTLVTGGILLVFLQLFLQHTVSSENMTHPVPISYFGTRVLN